MKYNSEKKIVFIVVNYKNYKEVVNYSNHLNNILGSKNIDIVIVNNSEKRDEFYNINSNVQVVELNENYGYFTALNKGLEYYIKIKKIPKWVVISNTDIKIKSSDFISKLDNEDAICIAPKIISLETKRNQNPFLIGRIKDRKLKILKIFYSNKVFFYLFNKLAKIKSDFFSSEFTDKVDKIYAAHGSFIIINKEFFRIGGTLYYSKLLYSEEIYLAEQIYRFGKQIKYLDNIEIEHNEHSTTGKIKNDIRRLKRYESISYILNWRNRQFE